jgi:hypothetical protein
MSMDNQTLTAPNYNFDLVKSRQNTTFIMSEVTMKQRVKEERMKSLTRLKTGFAHIDIYMDTQGFPKPQRADLAAAYQNDEFDRMWESNS